MKKYVAIIFIFLVSCNNSLDENCFVNDNKVEKNIKIENFKVDTLDKILRSNPKYVKIIEVKNNLSYDDEMRKLQEKNSFSEESEWKIKQKNYENKFSYFLKNFGEQFLFKQIQKEKVATYGIAENQFGYWFLEIKNKIAKAYFLGLSDFTYISENQEAILFKDDKLFLKGSLIRIRESWALPYGPQMESVKDFITFEIDLKEVRKDTDNDGFNDIFEKYIHLNPNLKDTDNDGISDFIDTNPLYKSEKSKFTDMYQQILETNYSNLNTVKLNYTFNGYHSDCEYFQKINPKIFKVIILPENLYKRNDYRRNIFNSSFSKIRKSKMDENIFYIYENDDSGTRNYTAEFVDGKWKIISQQTINI